jgi:hypothetical protein
MHRFQKSLIIVIILTFIGFIVAHFGYHPMNATIDYEHKHEPTRHVFGQSTIGKVVQQGQNAANIQRPAFKGPQNEMQTRVVQAFKHAWTGYKKYAWGDDELKPISKTKTSWFNLGLTIIDGMDTAIVMNLNDEYLEARDWIANKLNLDSDRYNNLFELTIRIIGGLLSAYHLKGDEVLLTKAYDCANRTLTAFSSPSQIPLSDVNLARREAKSPFWTTDSSISEVTTLQLEFKDLTYLTGDKRFSEAVRRVSVKVHGLNKLQGLVPIFISTSHGRFVGNTITLGARGDSYYEYLLKQWIQLGMWHFFFNHMDPTNSLAYLSVCKMALIDTVFFMHAKIMF